MDRLRELIDSGQFEWENVHHRVALLKAWVKGEFSRNRELFYGR